VLPRHDPEAAGEVACCGISRADYLQAQWAACAGRLLLRGSLQSQPRGRERLPVVLVDRPDVCFQIEEEALQLLERGERQAVVIHRREPARYREQLVLDEQGDVEGVRRTYASAVHRLRLNSEENGEATVEAEEVLAMLVSAEAAERVSEAVASLSQAPVALREAKIDWASTEAAVRDLSCGTRQRLKGRLLNLLRNRPETLEIAADHAGLVPTSFGWRHPTARVHPTARFVGEVIVGQEVSVGAGAVVIGPIILDDGELVADDAVRRASDEADAETLVAFREEPERALDDSQPRQHVRDESWWFRVGSPSLRRLMDLSGAAVMLAMLAVLIPAVWLANRVCGDRGPLFYTHLRQTRGGKPFPCIKFRSMVVNADELRKQLMEANELDGPQFKITRDPRITPVGNFLRKTNLDELPQALNILAGHMSLVGPRPSPHDENQLCPAWRHARLSVRPGITGLWQVYRSKVRGADDFQEWIHYDMEYVRRRSFKLDVKILFLTVLVCLGVWTPPDARRQQRQPD
jgi:lipopolysaccharide/colanic/teichoic acid biosynthesis glycosyltransferase